MASAVMQREKRKTAGQRMSSLVGKAMEVDDAFWGHETWAEEGSDNDSFHESDEDSAKGKDEFDSDFNDSESDHDDAEMVAGMEEEEEIRRHERSNQQPKNTYVDIAKGAKPMIQKKKGKGKRIMGDGINAGIVLNFPAATTAASASAATISQRQPLLQAPWPAAKPVPVPIPVLPFKKPARKDIPSLASRRERRSLHSARRLRETRSTPADPHPGKNISKPALTKKSKRRQYAQEELLLEAVHDTEPGNQRWLLKRKREDQTEKDKESMSLRDKSRGKVIQKYHSRRGCLITLTFPEMDSVPEILTRKKSAPEKPEQAYCLITGKPARYRDPRTKLGYYDVAAFKELRRRQQAGEPLDQKVKPKKPKPVPVEKPAGATPKVSIGVNGSSISKQPLPAVSGVHSILGQEGTCPEKTVLASTIMSSDKIQDSAEKASGNAVNTPSNLPYGPSGNVSNNMNSPPVSPSGRRLSSRRWKPSEKMLQNIIDAKGPEEGDGLTAGLHVQPGATSCLHCNDGAGNEADAVLSGIPSMEGTSTPVLASTKPVTNGNGVGVSSTTVAKETVAKETATTKKTTVIASLNKGGDMKKATAVAKKATVVPISESKPPAGAKQPVSKKAADPEKAADAAPPDKGPATKQVATKKRKIPEKSNATKEKKPRKKPTPAKKTDAANSTKRPAPSVASQPVASQPAISSETPQPASKSKPEQVYLWPAEDNKGGDQATRCITQSELIMEAITNYSRRQEERQNNANRK